VGKKKKGKKAKNKPADTDLQAQIDRLTKENAALQTRLEKIVQLAVSSRAPEQESDDEDDEYEELSHDVDDQIDEDEAGR
jgi:hypothetical protein